MVCGARWRPSAHADSKLEIPWWNSSSGGRDGRSRKWSRRPREIASKIASPISGSPRRPHRRARRVARAGRCVDPPPAASSLRCPLAAHPQAPAPPARQPQPSHSVPREPLPGSQAADAVVRYVTVLQLSLHVAQDLLVVGDRQQEGTAVASLSRRSGLAFRHGSDANGVGRAPTEVKTERGAFP